MLRLSCFVCLLLSPVLAIGADNTVTPTEAKSGWVSLFDGKTTTGWRNYKKDKIGDGWKVVDVSPINSRGPLGRPARRSRP